MTALAMLRESVCARGEWRYREGSAISRHESAAMKRSYPGPAKNRRPREHAPKPSESEDYPSRIFAYRHEFETRPTIVSEIHFSRGPIRPTFSIDVDTASDWNVRRFIESGSLPPRMRWWKR